MNNNERTIRLAFAAVCFAMSAFMFRRAIKIQDRRDAIRTQQIKNETSEMEIMSNRAMAIANHLDAKLETAQFWEIVTRP